MTTYWLDGHKSGVTPPSDHDVTYIEDFSASQDGTGEVDDVTRGEHVTSAVKDRSSVHCLESCDVRRNEDCVERLPDLPSYQELEETDN